MAILSSPCCMYVVVCCMLSGHRRRINTEEKAKVVAALWGAEFVKLLSALAVFTVKRFEEYD